MTDPHPVCFVDCETTSLHPETGAIWEVALIEPDGKEWSWMLPVSLRHADAISLSIGGFHERHPQGNRPSLSRVDDLETFAAEFAGATHGRHLAGAVVSFDAERLARLLRRLGREPSWHYHLIDVEALAVGYLAGKCGPGLIDIPQPGVHAVFDPRQLPWDSKLLSRAVGVDPTRFTAHEALEDARWARAIYRAVTGLPALFDTDQYVEQIRDWRNRNPSTPTIKETNA